MLYTYMPSPIGRLLLAGRRDALEIIGFSVGNQAREAAEDWERNDTAFAKTRRQLEEYFAGTRREFELELDPAGTPFQLSVLDELRKIPYGETVSYRDVAERIGKPKAVRAVGGANGSNPIPIVIPCHRVIGSNGSLTGFGGGLDNKRFLLSLELDGSGLFREQSVG